MARHEKVRFARAVGPLDAKPMSSVMTPRSSRVERVPDTNTSSVNVITSVKNPDRPSWFAATPAWASQPGS